MKENNEWPPGIKWFVCAGLGAIILTVLCLAHYYLPLTSVSYGTYNRIIQGLITSTLFTLIASAVLLIVDWITPREWFDFEDNIAKAIILAAIIAGCAYVWVNG
jgi:drug/metabolite transporter (DMT)-like permease